MANESNESTPTKKKKSLAPDGSSHVLDVLRSAAGGDFGSRVELKGLTGESKELGTLVNQLLVRFAAEQKTAASRREEIDRFLHGGADVCVATDVLGHGVNLPCETLLFAETTKFDGENRRPLEAWELAPARGAHVHHRTEDLVAFLGGLGL